MEKNGHMKKSIMTFALLSCLCFVSKAQVFEETMGTIPVEMTVSDLNAEKGFANSDRFTYQGDALIQPFGASPNNTDYVTMLGSQPSLGMNVRISDKHDCYFQINGINTMGMKKPVAGFAVLKGVQRFDGTDLAVEYSTDGVEWKELYFEPLPTGEGTALVFMYRKTSPLPNAPVLCLRFRQNGYGCVFRIDDVCVAPKGKK